MSTLTNKELVEKISEDFKNKDVKATKVVINEVIKSLIDITCEEVKEGNTVKLIGLVAIEPKYTPGRRGFSIKTKSIQEIPETVAVSLRAGSTLKASAKEIRPEVFNKLKDSYK